MDNSDGLGLVTMIDALGIKNANSEETRKFLTAKDRLFEELEHQEEILDSVVKEKLDKELDAPDTLLFGDTLILEWDLSGVENDPEIICGYVAPLFSYLEVLLVKSIKENILWRGAISVGKYIREDQIILGEAISDVASWYEESNWMGVHLTPKTNLQVEKHLLEEYSSCADYKVPLKDNPRCLLCTSWPRFYVKQSKHSEIRKIRTELKRDFFDFGINIGTERKYEHTLEFFDWYVENHDVSEEKQNKGEVFISEIRD